MSTEKKTFYDSKNHCEGVGGKLLMHVLDWPQLDIKLLVNHT